MSNRRQRCFGLFSARSGGAAGSDRNLRVSPQLEGKSRAETALPVARGISDEADRRQRELSPP